MKNKIHYSSESRRDLDDIWDYIVSELQNRSAAERVIDRNSITVVLFLATVTLELAQTMRFDPVPMILSEIFCANIGGSATMCGDPPNIKNCKSCVLIGSEYPVMDTLLFYFPKSSYCNLFRDLAECYTFSCFHDNVGLRDLPAIRHMQPYLLGNKKLNYTVPIAFRGGVVMVCDFEDVTCYTCSRGFSRCFLRCLA